MLFLLLTILVVYFILVDSYLDNRDSVKFSNRMSQGEPDARTAFYQAGFIRNLIMAGYLLSVFAIFSIPLSKLGFRQPSFDFFATHSTGLLVVCVILLSLYFLYFYLIPLVLVHLSAFIKEKVLAILKQIEPIMPNRRAEYIWWVVNSLNAVSEELLYRGFVFYYFSSLNVFLIIPISVFLDCCRYFPRFGAMRHVAMTGFIYAMAFVVFHSIYAPMAMHVIQDLSGLLMPVWLIRKPKAV